MPAKKVPTAKPKPGSAGTPTALILPEKLVSLVHYLRHEKVILDSDLAALYGVETSALNRAAKRNIERFPVDFMFCLTENEVAGLRCQSGISNADPHSLRSQTVIAKNAGSSQSGRASTRGGRRSLPYAFTEQGVAMLSSVLHSSRAVEVNIAIMRTFVQLRRLMDSNALLAEIPLPFRLSAFQHFSFYPENSASTPCLPPMPSKSQAAGPNPPPPNDP